MGKVLASVNMQFGISFELDDTLATRYYTTYVTSQYYGEGTLSHPIRLAYFADQ